MSNNSTIAFSAARKLATPNAFTTLAKPVGSVCNLSCAYCYYLDKADLYGGHEPIMSDELLELYIRQYIEAVEVPTVTFCWHGGEPLIAGLDFFRKAVMWQQEYRGGKLIENTLQTNGILVNDEWCEFFHEHHFLIGLSLDGPEDIHDSFRRDKGGQATFARVLHAVQLMATHSVDFNILCTVNAHSTGRGKEVYHFLRNLSPFIQFLPVLEYVNDKGHIVSPGTPEAQPTPYSIHPEAFGQFICDVYDEWVRADVGRIFIQLFDNTLAQWCGIPSSLCAFTEICGDGLVVEHNGDVYSCDHFVYPQHKLGNIRDTHLGKLYHAPEHFRFGAAKYDMLPGVCRHCRWLFLCHGECPKHRFSSTTKGEDGLNSLCKGYKQFFAHTENDMKIMRGLIEKQRPPSLIMQEKQ